MFTICFYQDSRHREPLQWMRSVLEIGHLHDRVDGITELRINGYSQVQKILQSMQPYIRFKKQQVATALKILEAIEGKSFLSLSVKSRTQLADWFSEIREANYHSSARKFSADEIKELLTR